jgi:1,2-diacylglycerol 3-alpha-glucosyltransferase
VLLYVGRLGKEKNLEFLLHATKVLTNSLQDVKLIFVGDGNDKPRLQGLTQELDMERHVIFTGFLPREDVRHFYADADAFVFSSKTDTQGMVISEAAAAGLPIVMVEDKGLTPIVEHERNGFVIAESHHEYAHVISKFLTDNKRRQAMGEESKKIADAFSIEAQTKKLETLYEEARHAHTSSNWRETFWKQMNKEVSLDAIKQLPIIRGRDAQRKRLERRKFL